MMKQFDLDKWLQDKSRKVVTRDGREVDIYYSPTSRIPLIGRTSDNEIHQYTENGFQNEMMNQAKNDIFFADEEEELTEFERTLSEIINFWQRDNCSALKTQSKLKSDAKTLFDLARKEILKEFRCREELFYKNGFEKCRESILENLPKWKYINQIQSGNHYAHIANGIINPSGYFISYDDLETLPKEE